LFGFRFVAKTTKLTVHDLDAEFVRRSTDAQGCNAKLLGDLKGKTARQAPVRAATFDLLQYLFVFHEISVGWRYPLGDRKMGIDQAIPRLFFLSFSSPSGSRSTRRW